MEEKGAWSNTRNRLPLQNMSLFNLLLQLLHFTHPPVFGFKIPVLCSLQILTKTMGRGYLAPRMVAPESPGICHRFGKPHV